MIRYDCLEWLASRITDELVLTSLSGQRIEWAHLSRHEGNLLVGMMGMPLGMAMGLALALPHRRVIALESDGSVLISLFNLATLGNLRPPNLTVFVFDNGAYSGTRISQPTATAGNTDLEAVARGAGVEYAVTVRELQDFQREATAALQGQTPGPHFIVCKVEQSLLHREIPRPTIDLMENKYTFVRYLERTEGKPNPFIGRG